jgi:hypothetical protein
VLGPNSVPPTDNYRCRCAGFLPYKISAQRHRRLSVSVKKRVQNRAPGTRLTSLGKADRLCTAYQNDRPRSHRHNEFTRDSNLEHSRNTEPFRRNIRHTGGAKQNIVTTPNGTSGQAVMATLATVTEWRRKRRCLTNVAERRRR